MKDIRLMWLLVAILFIPALLAKPEPQAAKPPKADYCSLKYAKRVSPTDIREVLPLENLTYYQLRKKYGDRLSHIYFCSP